MKNPLLVPELEELLDAGRTDALREFCCNCHPATVAEFLSALEPERARAVLAVAPLESRAEIFAQMEDDVQSDIVELLERREMAELLTEMHPDDRARLFRRLPDDRQELVLPALARAEREDIRRLASYEEGTAGAIMTSDYAALPPDLTAAQALERLRQVAPDTETIYTAYVVGQDRILLGSVTLRDLMVAPRNTLVSDLVQDEVISVKVTDDQEEAARTIQKYDLIALPVVTDTNALVGIITYDDAIDVLSREHTEDVEKLMAIAGPHEENSYMRTSPWQHFRNRIGWVAALGVVGMLSGGVVERYEGALQQFAILAAFMPMLADAGGNTGSQSTTLVIRGLATRELDFSDLPRVLLKETVISVLLSLMLAVIVFGRVFFQHGAVPAGFHWGYVALVIALSVSAQVVSATLIGALLPMGAAKLKLDPALVASPLLTTLVDVTGLVFYFAIASAMLGL